MYQSFVTGGTGFLGSHLVDALLKRGDQVTCLIRKSSNTRWLDDKNVRLLVGDLRGKEISSNLKAALQQADFIFHAGGIVSGLRRKDYFAVNADGTKKILEVLKSVGARPQCFLLISSLAAAGPGHESIPINELQTSSPVSWYGESKLQAENAALEFKKIFPVTIVRPPPVYGPRDENMLQIFKLMKRGFIVTAAKGTRTNFVYVSDLVSGILSASITSSNSGEIFNIGSDENLDSTDAFMKIANSIGLKTRNIHIPLSILTLAALVSEAKMKLTHKADIFNLQKLNELKQINWMMDISKAKAEIDYAPQMSIEQGGLLSYNWYKEQGWL